MTAHKRRDRNTWDYFLELDRGPDGKRRRAHGTGYPTKRAALAAENEHRARLNQGLLPEAETATVGEYLAFWLRQVEPPTIERSTHIRYEQLLRLHAAPISQKRLLALRPLDVQALYKRVEAAGLSARTAEQLHAVLHKAFGQAVRWQYLARNPADAVEKPRPQRPDLRVPKIHEIRLLLAKGDETPFGRIYRLSALTGLREGELIALHWSEVDFEHSLLIVKRNARRFKGEGVVMKDTKSHRWRGVALSTTAITLLQEQREAQLVEMMAEAADYAHDDLVFADALGRPFDPTRVGRVWRDKVARPMGLEGVRLHNVRHAHASALMAMGVNPKVISERLGHYSTAFTQDVYGHVAPTLQADAAEAFDELLRGV